MATLVYPNYISPNGYIKLKSELSNLLKKIRPTVVETVSWAASNGDRSENGDYIYGKKRLREIDRRIHFLTKTLETIKVVDPLDQLGNEQIFFGATVKYSRFLLGDDDSINQKLSNAIVEEIVIVGKDETDLKKGHISWVSPLAKAITKSRAGDEVTMNTPSGLQLLKILSVLYKKI